MKTRRFLQFRRAVCVNKTSFENANRYYSNRVDMEKKMILNLIGDISHIERGLVNHPKPAKPKTYLSSGNVKLNDATYKTTWFYINSSPNCIPKEGKHRQSLYGHLEFGKLIGKNIFQWFIWKINFGSLNNFCFIKVTCTCCFSGFRSKNSLPVRVLKKLYFNG